MGIKEVRDYLKKWEKDKFILEFDSSSATVELAAEALKTSPARIAKSISLKNGDGAMIVVTAGDSKIDNSKFKSEFGFKAKMLTAAEVVEFIGHAVGGVCPFAIKSNVPVYLDISMKRFDTLFPACGSSNSAIELTCDELEEYSHSIRWVDVCKMLE